MGSNIQSVNSIILVLSVEVREFDKVPEAAGFYITGQLADKKC